MKKKVLYGVIMTVLACTSVGTLQSCKDDLSDAIQQASYDRAQLKAYIDQVKADLERGINTNAADIADLKKRVTDLENNSATKAELEELKKLVATQAALQAALDRIATLESQMANANTSITALQTSVAALQTALQTLQDSYNTLAANYADLSTKYADLSGQVSDLSTKYTDLSTKYTELSGKVATLETALEGLEEFKNEVNNEFTQVYLQLAENTNLINQVYTLMNEGFDNVNGEIAGIKSDISDILQALNNHDVQISNLLNQIISLRNDMNEQFDAVNAELTAQGLDIDNLYGEVQRLEAMDNKIIADIVKTNARIDEFFSFNTKIVSSILIQGTNNPLFGDFSLPLGIQSNMLFNWYGQYLGADPMFFPNASAKYTYNSEESELTAQELKEALKSLGYPVGGAELIQPGEYLMNGGLGTLYATINPVNVDFNNTAFSLETSKGTRLPFQVIMTPSEEELSFGYVRSTSNGFYEANVSLDNVENSDLEAAIEATRITIDEDVKQAAKDLYKDRSKRNALNLLKSLYSSMSGFMPRYALRYDWTSSLDGKTVENAVLSQYNLAVATAKPLSYAFADGVHGSYKLPHVGSLSNLISELIDEDFKFDFSDQHLDGIIIKYDPIKFSTKIDMSGLKKIVVTIPSISVWDINDPTKEIAQSHQQDAEISDEDWELFKADIQDAFNKAIASMEGDVNASMEKMIKDNIQDQINSMINQVNDMLDNMAGEINDKIANIVNKLENNRLVDAVNKVIDLYNRVASQLDRIIANPNNYLQPVFFYEGSDRPHILSTSKVDPTFFKRKGGDAFNIYASSYSAELLAPAYKKFIACTGVSRLDKKEIKMDTKVLVANVNESNSYNDHKGMFGVLPGNFKRITVNTENMEPGYVYEITYQGIDYSGKTSTQKFYVTIKD